jgi:hypothetical protein
LAALNAPLVVEAAKRLAARATAEAGGGDDGAFVERLWRAALSRPPTPEEREAAVAWLAAEATRTPVAGSDAAPGGAPAPAPAGPSFGLRDRLAQAVLATAEFEFID